ncbi:hypothetical protein ACFUC1_14210 [Pedococcus sp. NPDC057267]|uniref:hypothetical protein n=1 Tax=Pedococcus sp. NPDC057267 TaxID=3346077 RepID=UPI003644A6C4
MTSTDRPAQAGLSVPLARGLMQSAATITVAALALAACGIFGWAVFASSPELTTNGDPAALIAAFAVAIFGSLGAAVAVAGIRSTRAHPALLLHGDELLVRDMRVMSEDWPLQRDQVARVDLIERRSRLSSNWPRKDEFGCSPFSENWNLRIRFASPTTCPVARQGVLGNWIWKMVFARAGQPVGGPNRLDPYGGFVCRVQDPAAAQAALERWASG